MSIRGYVTRSRSEEVGFECGLCKKKFRVRSDIKEYKSEWDRAFDVSEWPVCLCRAKLSFDHPDGEGPQYSDFCTDCYYKIKKTLEEMGVKFLDG